MKKNAKKIKTKKIQKPLKKKTVGKVKASSIKIKDSNFNTYDNSTSTTKIKIIGIGGGGCSIISEISSTLKRADFVAANTDKRALKSVSQKNKVFQFGELVTKGFGTGMSPELGKEAANQEKEKIKKMLEGQDICIFVSSLGGGTGSGATPVFAKTAKDLGIITYGIFTLPFSFEGSRKMEIAEESLRESESFFNALTILPNENIFNIIDKNTPLKEALSAINRNLSESLTGLMETIYNPGLINIDFADLKTVLEERGKKTYINTIVFDSDKGVDDAVKKVISSPFYSYGIDGASGVLFNISGSDKIGLKEVSTISEGIGDLIGKNSKIIFGISHDKSMGNKNKISLLAVGCNGGESFYKEKKELNVKNKKKKTVLKNKKKNKIEEVFKKNETSIDKDLVKKEKPLKNITKKDSPKKEETDKEKKVEVVIRRNALQSKKTIKEAENGIIEKENKWETPAFLRRGTLKENNND